MDFAKLSLSDKLILGGAALLTIAMFLPWFTAEGFGYSDSRSGFDYFLNGTIPWLLAVVMAGKVLMEQLKPDQELPELPIPNGQANLIAGGVACALVVLRLLLGEDDGGGIVDVSRGIGLFLAVIATGGLAYAGFLKKGEDEGVSSAAPPAPPTEF